MLVAAARGRPGCVSMTTCSAGDPPEVDAVSAGWTGGCPKPAPGSLPCRPEAPVHPQTPEGPALLLAQRLLPGAGLCRGPQAARLGRQDQICLGPWGSVNVRPSGGSAAQLGVWPAAGTRTLSHLAPAPPRTQASMAVSRPVACASRPGPVCPQPLPHLGPGPRGPVPPAGRRVRSLAVIARSWGAGRPPPQGGGSRGASFAAGGQLGERTRLREGVGGSYTLGAPSGQDAVDGVQVGSQGAPRGGAHSPAAPRAAVWAASRPPGPRAPAGKGSPPQGAGALGPCGWGCRGCSTPLPHLL